MPAISMTTRRAMLAALLLASAAAVPQAASPRYTVEIVVFLNGGQIGALPAGTAAIADVDEGIEITPATSRKLASAADRLRRNGMKVIAHTSWIQSPVSCGGAACRNAVRGVSAAQLGIAQAGIAGKAGVQRGSTGLFLGVDLTVEDGGRRYRIQESRSIKADQPQYFDHPAIGVLATVTTAPATP